MLITLFIKFMIWIWDIKPNEDILGLFAFLGVFETVFVSVALVSLFVNWLSERRKKRGNGSY